MASVVFVITIVATAFRNAMLQLIFESGGVGMIGNQNHSHSNLPWPILATLTFDIIIMIPHSQQHTYLPLLNLATPQISSTY